jgi:N-acyl-D-aspartate/D-glutamate deacylase
MQYDLKIVGGTVIDGTGAPRGRADLAISRPTGIEAVVVNGTVHSRGGKDRVDPRAPLPGRLLRRGAG